MKLRFCPSIILLYTVASVEQHLRPHASGCTPAILKNEGMPEGVDRNLTKDSEIEGFVYADRRGAGQTESERVAVVSAHRILGDAAGRYQCIDRAACRREVH